MLLAATSGYGLIRWLNWIMFTPLAFIRFDRRAVNVIASTFVLLAGLMAIGIGLQSMGVLSGTWGGVALSSPATGYQSHLIRYTSFLQNPNDLALFMLMAALVLLCISLATTRRLRLLGFVASALCIGVIFLSTSRGALIALPVGLGLLLLSAGARTIAYFVGSFFVVAVLALSTPTVGLMAEKTVGSLASIVSGTDLSATARQSTWKARLESAGNPIIGTGYGGYAHLTEDDIRSNERSELAREITVDNSWLKLWLESGTLGVVLLLAIFGVTQKETLGLAAKTPRGLVAALVSALLAVLFVRAMTTDVLDINPWNFVLWLLIGVGFSVRTLDADSHLPDAVYGVR
jgi:O-antigen ligase